MGKAKQLRIRPISSRDAAQLTRRLHYSGKALNNSQLHLGVFWNGRVEGVMQFGPSMDKRKVQGLVSGTKWNEFIELNRMAFGPALPRNSESRALAIAFRIIRKQYPHIKWVLSFADATQCGDGTIYRAAGFVLTGIKRNSTLLKMPNGEIVADNTLNSTKYKVRGQSAGYFKRRGASALEGHQLRYIYFLDPTARERLTVPIIPFAKIQEMGAGMYKGKPREKQAMADPTVQRRGSADLHAPGT